ncbi:hypothetical protein PRELSG_0006350 [Plasmodium relictum]|uniref:Uncharacterized protein n=1 Tax=Plasmodium relictum TaxID=85471 RepID=A0A1J1GKI3_PLARL|nr:hypothetical protein PRELSG_0006350 [Plasmodium relictum]CRG85211.1 hypothetical protein PRELSG_0006350 [Plasmodium relictum]
MNGNTTLTLALSHSTPTGNVSAISPSTIATPKLYSIASSPTTMPIPNPNNSSQLINGTSTGIIPSVYAASLTGSSIPANISIPQPPNSSQSTTASVTDMALVANDTQPNHATIKPSLTTSNTISSSVHNTTSNSSNANVNASAPNGTIGNTKQSAQVPPQNSFTFSQFTQSPSPTNAIQTSMDASSPSAPCLIIFPAIIFFVIIIIVSYYYKDYICYDNNSLLLLL